MNNIFRNIEYPSLLPLGLLVKLFLFGDLKIPCLVWGESSETLEQRKMAKKPEGTREQISKQREF